MMALAVMAAPEEFVSKNASGSTAATVYFEPGPRVASLLVADVTSDKAASVLSWRTGSNSVTLLAASAADVTNTYTTVGLIASNAALVSVRADGTVTAHNAFTNSFFTNALVTLENPIGTNAAVGSIATKVLTRYLTILNTNSAKVITVASNDAYLNVGTATNFLFMARPDQIETNQVASWTTNGANFIITLSNNFAFNPLRAYVLTNSYTVSFVPATNSNAYLILTNGTGITNGDSLLILPSTGGASLRQIQTVADYRVQLTPLKAVTGIALAAGDRLFVLDTAYTTPVGAATLRLLADPVRILPPNQPAVLSVDGTSACAVNAAVVRYR